MVRPTYSDKLNVKRGVWTSEEDAKMTAYVSKNGRENWTALSKKSGIRCGKSCKLRSNCLRPDLKHDTFTPQEEELIVRLHAAIGSRWFIIAQQLPGRTDNDVKNYWNTKLRKKLKDMGIDPVTHKPFSQIVADYGNIGCLLKYGTRTGSHRDLKNAFVSKPPQSNTPTSLMLPPKLEPVQELRLSENDVLHTNHSFDLLDQLQAIKLVTETSSFASSSSSSSTCSTAAQEKSGLSFSWRDFLLDDAFLPAGEHLQEHENGMAENVKLQDYDQNNGAEAVPERSSFHQLPSNSSHTSFVEAILDQQNEILFDFPNLLEEPFFC